MCYLVSAVDEGIGNVIKALEDPFFLHGSKKVGSLYTLRQTNMKNVNMVIFHCYVKVPGCSRKKRCKNWLQGGPRLYSYKWGEKTP